jgi:uncharacterized membrane protein YuzA (DUF378 family)
VTARPWARLFLWVSALVLGGIGIVVFTYTLISGAHVSYAFAVYVIALLAVVYMILVVGNFARSKQNSRVHDRERRGF